MVILTSKTCSYDRHKLLLFGIERKVCKAIISVSVEESKFCFQYSIKWLIVAIVDKFYGFILSDSIIII